MIGTAGNPHRASAGTGLIDDLRFTIYSGIASEEQMNGSGVVIKNGARVAAGIGFVVPDDFMFAPGGPVVRTSSRQIDTSF